MQIDEILEPNTLYSFYGVDNQYFKIGSIIFEAIEDPDDGYRSYLESISVVNYCGIFHKLPLANVQYKRKDGGCQLIDEKSHIWLTIGTDYGSDEYYPTMIFHYTPAETTEYASQINNLDELNPLDIHVEKFI